MVSFREYDAVAVCIFEDVKVFVGSYNYIKLDRIILACLLKI